MRTAIRTLDRGLRCALGVFEFCDAPDCLLRVRVISVAHALSLPGRVVAKQAPLLELHLWNEHIPPLPPDGPDLAWAVQTQRRLIASFHVLADQMSRDPRFAAVQAVGGITVMLLPGNGTGGEKLFRRLGFWVFPYHSALGRFGEFWENLYSWWIMWTFNPATLHHRQLIHLHRTEVWMLTDEFLRRYGANGERRPSGVTERYH